MRIRLLDIGDEGQTFEYKRGEEQELDHVLLGVLPRLGDYKFQVHILPAGEIYVAQGNFQFQIDEACSLCAEDMSLSIKNKFNEYLVQESQREAKGHAPHTGLDLNNTQEVTFFSGQELDMSDFVREQFATALPTYPKCEDKTACEERQKENAKHYDKQALQGHPAFGVLEKLKKH